MESNHIKIDIKIHGKNFTITTSKHYRKKKIKTIIQIFVTTNNKH